MFWPKFVRQIFCAFENPMSNFHYEWYRSYFDIKIGENLENVNVNRSNIMKIESHIIMWLGLLSEEKFISNCQKIDYSQSLIKRKR